MSLEKPWNFAFSKFFCLTFQEDLPLKIIIKWDICNFNRFFPRVLSVSPLYSKQFTYFLWTWGIHKRATFKSSLVCAKSTKRHTDDVLYDGIHWAARRKVQKSLLVFWAECVPSKATSSNDAEDRWRDGLKASFVSFSEIHKNYCS